MNCNSLRRAVINANISMIEMNIFRHCRSLEYVTLPSGLQQIGYYSLSDCPSLQTIDLPDMVTEIGAQAFWRSGLRFLCLPESVKEIKLGAFMNCSSLTQVQLNCGLEKIDPLTFLGCISLEEVFIPSSVYLFGQRIFEGCSYLSIECMKDTGAEQYATWYDIPIVYRIDEEDIIYIYHLMTIRR